jgi:putative aldouronate transport system substrate-binding protein
MRRRALFATAARGAVATAIGLPLLSACAPSPRESSGGASGSATPGANAKAGGPLPSFAPFTTGPKPDYRSTDTRVVDAFEHYPNPPFKAWTKEPPGSGGRVDVLIAAYYPPPTPFEQNATWREVNKRLNADVRMNIIPATDWRTKFATSMAGGDLPDIIHVYFGVGWTANTVPFLKAQAADLTPYLAGDAIKEYPNLAAIPSYAWQNSMSAIDGKLYQWPIHRYLPGLAYFFKNTDIYDKEIGADYVPKDAQDFRKVMEQLNRPQSNRWAMGNVGTSPGNLSINGYAAMFGAPNIWGKDASGKLVRSFETEQYKAAVGYVRDLWSAGLMWPDAPSGTGSRSNFAAGRFALSVEGFGNSWNDFWRQGLEQNPPNHFDIIKPFSAAAGGPVVNYLSGGWVSSTALKKASPDRIKELLRVVDWLASPFGSEEDLLLTYGIEGQDHTRDANGDPKLGPSGNGNAGYVPWRYVAQHPYVTYQADLPGYTKRTFDVEQMLLATGVQDATNGFYAASAYSSAATTALQTFNDGVNDILYSRRPMSDYDQLVKDWQRASGDAVRKEYTEAMSG